MVLVLEAWDPARPGLPRPRRRHSRNPPSPHRPQTCPRRSRGGPPWPFCLFASASALFAPERVRVSAPLVVVFAVDVVAVAVAAAASSASVFSLNSPAPVPFRRENHVRRRGMAVLVLVSSRSAPAESCRRPGGPCRRCRQGGCTTSGWGVARWHPSART